MKKSVFASLMLLTVLVASTKVCYAQTRFSVENGGVVFTDGKDVLRTPSEGLWSVATGWKDDWMTDWTHVKASKVERTGAWTILKGKASFAEGDLELTDSYSETAEGLVRCVRRFEWTGKDTLRNVTLSVRLQEGGTDFRSSLRGSSTTATRTALPSIRTLSLHGTATRERSPSSRITAIPCLS